MRGATEEEVNDVFDRINTYGHRLSDQERRQAGVQNEFTDMVRTLACTVRGDESYTIVPLRLMPSISIDLPMTKHGYYVQADEVFWVQHGILRATDLRDSMDEQCIADIAACVIGGHLIERSKETLDEIYTSNSEQEQRITDALTVFGADRFAAEFKFCVDEILRVCNAENVERLRNLIYPRSQTNAFPSVFAVMFFAFHELIFGEGMIVSDYDSLKKALRDITTRLETGRRATSPDERRRNVDSVKGLIRASFIKSQNDLHAKNGHSTADIDATIRRSEVELGNYELKQGLLDLSESRQKNDDVINKVLKTICAISNNGRSRTGKILIGISDKIKDTSRISELDRITPRKVGRRQVVGVEREARILNITTEAYLSLWKNSIRNSTLTISIKNNVLSSIDYNSYYGLGVIVVTIPEAKELCYLDDEIYWREGDTTKVAKKTSEIISVAGRF